MPRPGVPRGLLAARPLRTLGATGGQGGFRVLGFGCWGLGLGV